ncbi:hypothetical protein LCGC14_0694940 [marine sediment metagenome]|uniref:Uncharacterized protein n=1 Tax=marine sediment metagenome TaxID=412755 RepID=A0A0F9QPF5_9ZZZZ
MNKEFPYLIMLSKPEHYHIELCSLTGQDYVPYMKNEIFDWLDETMEQYVDYIFENNINPYKPEPETEKVGIAFVNEADAVAFKLRWL